MGVRHIARAQLGDRVVAGEIREGRLFVRHGDVPFLGEPTGESFPLPELCLLPPVAPSKVVAVALNYRAHALEMNKPLPPEPLFFLKPSTSVIGPLGTVRLPRDSEEVHYEAEMGLVIGKRLANATEAQAREALFGVTGVIDVTARDIQRRQNHYTRGKGYDTFCPIGPTIACGLEPEDLRVQLRQNGVTRQDGRTNDLIFGPFQLLSFLSGIMTLLPGDVVSTGTPSGVGPMKGGDRIELEVEGVGVLAVSVAGP
jgi:2-keto-4-pentenoate hydratase/2-oxohepta-3-ene-1,7-dioic acid hydratase in catechol pathway